MKKPKPKTPKKARKTRSVFKRVTAILRKKQPAERDHEFNPEDVARINND